MNYKEARVYLDQVSKYGSVLGLDNMRELLCRLGNPQDDLKFIHISGTNGKGSVLAYLSTVLSGAGYRTGRYLSPTLFSYRERIQVDGEKIDRESLAAHVTAIAEAARDMKEQEAGVPTVFEVETALAFLYFKEKNCDIVVLETGLGGALDATNVITTPVMEVIASISMDHMAFLGDTLEKIAWQKAGIIKPGTVVVSAKQERPAEDVIRRACRERDCELHILDPDQLRDVRYGCERQFFSYKNWKNVEISLAGSYQILNAALALEALDALRKRPCGASPAAARTEGGGEKTPRTFSEEPRNFWIEDRQVYEGLRSASWRGRFTLIGKSPDIIMDGAHNPAAAQVLRESLELYFKGRGLRYIFGVFRDKDYETIIALTAPLAEHIVTVETPGNPRALPAGELRDAVAKVNPSVEAADSVAEAVRITLEQADQEDVIVIFGSLSFLGEAERAVIRYREECGGNHNG